MFDNIEIHTGKYNEIALKKFKGYFLSDFEQKI